MNKNAAGLAVVMGLTVALVLGSGIASADPPGEIPPHGKHGAAYLDLPRPPEGDFRWFTWGDCISAIASDPDGNLTRAWEDFYDIEIETPADVRDVRTRCAGPPGRPPR